VDDEALDAGELGGWLRELRDAVADGGATAVACGTCTAASTRG